MRDKTDKDFKGVLTKPSEEKRAAFQEREELMRKNLPQEMLERPNWVAVVVFQDKAKGKLLKLQIDPKTGNPASPYEPSTWSDFGTACQYAKENGCVALAYVR